MNVRQLAQVGIGLIGVWALVGAVETFAAVVFVARSGGPAMLAASASTVLLFGLSYLLVFRSAGIAAVIAPDVDADVDADSASASASPELERTLIRVAAVLLLGLGVPGIVTGLLTFATTRGLTDAGASGIALRRFAGSAAQVAFALYLIARPERLLELAKRSAQPD